MRARAVVFHIPPLLTVLYKSVPRFAYFIKYYLHPYGFRDGKKIHIKTHDTQ